ncbi:MAG TPA: hypothetical protein VFS45_00195, partial [Sphingomicrobium sp.]|nr:hypothetical protein [Sphingomicrobium sp.]
MLRTAAAALAALAPVAAIAAQGAAPATDFNTARPALGAWAYQPAAGGSMARFVDTTGTARLVLQCAR